MKFIAIGSAFVVTRSAASEEQAPESGSILQTANMQPMRQQMGLSQERHLGKTTLADSSNLELLDQKITQFEQGDPNTLTVAELDLVKSLISTLENEFGSELDKQSEDDKTDYASKKAAHEACTTHKDKRLHTTTGDVTIAKNRIAGKKVKHTACRKAEKSMNELTADATEVGHGTWGSLADVPGVIQTSAYSTFCTRRETFSTDLQAYKNLVPAQAVSASCDVDQDRFETGFCSWLTAKKKTCIGYDECIAAVDLANFKDLVNARITRRRAVWHTIQKLKCRLQHVHDTFKVAGTLGTTADSCDNTAAPPSSKFDLALEVPAVVQCSQDDDITNVVQPSVADVSKCTAWKSQEYTYDLAEHTSPATFCQSSCEVPIAVGIATVAAGCTDTNDAEKVCPFYSIHSDACGHYSNGAASCCACGGGSTSGVGGAATGGTPAAPTPAAPTPAAPTPAAPAPAAPTPAAPTPAAPTTATTTVNPDCIATQSVDGTSQLSSRASTFDISLQPKGGCAIRADDNKLECWGSASVNQPYDGAVRDYVLNRYSCAVGLDNIAHVKFSWTQSTLQDLGTYNNVKFCATSAHELCLVYLDDKDTTCLSNYQANWPLEGPKGGHTMKKSLTGAKALAMADCGIAGIAEDDTLQFVRSLVNTVGDETKTAQTKWEEFAKKNDACFNGGHTWETGIKVKRITSNTFYGMCAIKMDDTVMCSHGSHASLDAPIESVTDIKVKDVSMGSFGLCVVRLVDSEVQCWWSDPKKSAEYPSSPDTPADLGKAVAVIVAGPYGAKGACAQLESGRIRCWGFQEPPSDLVAASTSC